MTFGRSWSSYSSADVDAAVERAQERELARYEAEQDRLDAEAEAYWAEQDMRGDAGSQWERRAA